jgi:hypothetical protein
MGCGIQPHDGSMCLSAYGLLLAARGKEILVSTLCSLFLLLYTVIVVCLIGRIFGLCASLLLAWSNWQCSLLLCRTSVTVTWIKLENMNLTANLFCDKYVLCVNVFHVLKVFH